MKNRLIIDFDAMPDEVAAELADGIEQFVNASRDHFGVRLHGTCSSLDHDTLEWEVKGRTDLRRRLGTALNNTRVGENPFEREC